MGVDQSKSGDPTPMIRNWSPTCSWPKITVRISSPTFGPAVLLSTSPISNTPWGTSSLSVWAVAVSGNRVKRAITTASIASISSLSVCEVTVQNGQAQHGGEISATRNRLST